MTAESLEHTTVASARVPAAAWMAIAACVLALGAAWWAAAGRNRIDDDAYMFVRYARNLASHGVLAWNPGGPAVYGLTSLAHFALVALAAALLRADPAIVLVASTTAAGVAFLSAAAALAWRAWPNAGRSARALAVALATAGFAWAAPGLVFHFTSGMDTALALVWASGLWLSALAWERSPSRRVAIAWGVLGGASLWVRPDLLAFGIGAPVVCAVLAPSRVHRRAALAAVACAACTALVLAAIAWATLGSSLPLALQAKVTRGYGPDMDAVYAGFAARQLGRFVLEYAPLFALAVAGLAVALARGGARRAAVDLAAATSAAAFIGFHALFVLPIMGDHQRFDYPALPAVLLVAVRGAHRIGERLVAPPAAAGRRARAALIARTAIVVWACTGLARTAWEARRAPAATGLRVAEHYRNGWPGRMWARLDRVAQLPDDVVIATTEVGMPGVMNPGKQIVDLAGLNDAEFARHGFSAERLFARVRPDLFYLTVRHYESIRGALFRDPRFAQGYERLQPPGGLLIALRRDSPHYARLRAAIVGP